MDRHWHGHTGSKMAYTKLIPRSTPGAQVEEISRDSAHYRLTIPSGKADKYRLAQLDDYTLLSRRQFSHHFHLSLSLSARTSSNFIPGTWGFGLWNDPFGLSLGFGGNPFRLPALPNAVWFFGASGESYLSFKDSRVERSYEGSLGSADDTRPGGRCRGARINYENRTSSIGFANNAQPSAQRGASNGFLAQTFRAPKFHPSLILAGMAFPFSRTTARRLLGKIIDEDGIRLNVDATEWHRYQLDWRESRVSFEVDDAQVFESPVSPNPPLGLVIWIDNQFAAFTPEGKIGFGVLENREPACLEIKDLELNA